MKFDFWGILSCIYLNSGAQCLAVIVWVISVGSTPLIAVPMGVLWQHADKRRACWMAHLSPGSPLRQRAPPAPLQDATAQAMPTAASSLTAGTAHMSNKQFSAKSKLSLMMHTIRINSILMYTISKTQQQNWICKIQLLALWCNC